MTDRSVSWTDADSVARLLARATSPRRAVSTLTRAAVVARSARQVPRSSPPPARFSVPAPAPAAPIAVAAPPARPVVPRLEQLSDNPSDRLDALLAWTLDHQPCAGAFVADDNGLTLAAHGITEAHVSLVGPLLSALMGVRTIPGIDATSGALWLGANMMSWVEARTNRGGFCLGTVGDEALSVVALSQLKEALEDTVRGL
jgi:hypothetical protein